MKKKYEEIARTIDKFVQLRDKCKTSKNKKVHLEYNKYLDLCIDKLDYLIDIKTKKYRNFSNYEDLRQDGRVALMLALKSYDPKKGDIYWWANQYIKTRVCREANRHSTMKIPIKKAKEMSPYKVSQMPVMICGDQSALDVTETIELRDLVREAVEKLPPEQRRAIQLHFELDGFKSHSIDRICDEMDISRVDCVRLLSEAKINLKEKLEMELG